MFHHGVDPTSPAAGSRVKLHGKITKLAKHCPTEGFTPTITVRKVDIRKAGHNKGSEQPASATTATTTPMLQLLS